MSLRITYIHDALSIFLSNTLDNESDDETVCVAFEEQGLIIKIDEHSFLQIVRKREVKIARGKNGHVKVGGEASGNCVSVLRSTTIPLSK